MPYLAISSAASPVSAWASSGVTPSASALASSLRTRTSSAAAAAAAAAASLARWACSRRSSCSLFSSLPVAVRRPWPRPSPCRACRSRPTSAAARARWPCSLAILPARALGPLLAAGRPAPEHALLLAAREDRQLLELDVHPTGQGAVLTESNVVLVVVLRGDGLSAARAGAAASPSGGGPRWSDADRGAVHQRTGRPGFSVARPLRRRSSPSANWRTCSRAGDRPRSRMPRSVTLASAPQSREAGPSSVAQGTSQLQTKNTSGLALRASSLRKHSRTSGCCPVRAVAGAPATVAADLVDHRAVVVLIPHLLFVSLCSPLPSNKRIISRILVSCKTSQRDSGSFSESFGVGQRVERVAPLQLEALVLPPDRGGRQCEVARP